MPMGHSANKMGTERVEEEVGDMTGTQGPNNSSSLDDQAFKILTAFAIGLMVTGTVVYRLLEDWSWVDSLYFSVVAVTTVGFGDLVPSTDASKLFTVAYVLGGIAIVAAYLHAQMNRIGKRRMGRRHQ
jgi:hypothetical protein